MSTDDVKRWEFSITSNLGLLTTHSYVLAADHDAAMLDLQIVIDGLTAQAAKNDAYYEFEKKRLSDLIAARDRRIEELEQQVLRWVSESTKQDAELETARRVREKLTEQLEYIFGIIMVTRDASPIVLEYREKYKAEIAAIEKDGTK